MMFLLVDASSMEDVLPEWILYPRVLLYIKGLLSERSTAFLAELGFEALDLVGFGEFPVERVERKAA